MISLESLYSIILYSEGEDVEEIIKKICKLLNDIDAVFIIRDSKLRFVSYFNYLDYVSFKGSSIVMKPETNNQVYKDPFDKPMEIEHKQYEVLQYMCKIINSIPNQIDRIIFIKKFILNESIDIIIRNHSISLRKYYTIKNRCLQYVARELGIV